jgi:hypothetical protein
MTKSILRPVLFLPILILALASCRKDLNSAKNSISVAGSTVKAGPIPPVWFNWETETYLPSATSTAYNPLPMPWNSGTTAIDPNLANDYKSVDGWQLVWSTFAPTIVLNDPSHTYFFALYNKYRGILRFYLWQQASSVATSYVNHGLSLYTSSGSGTTSKMLNFNATDIIDPTTNQKTFSQVLTQQINSAGGTWFVFQYEIAYDPNVPNTSFSDFGLEWTSQWASVTAITLNGTQTGTISGYLGSPSTGSFNFGHLLTSAATTILGGINYASMLSILGGTGTANPYTAAVTNGLNGIAKGFLNAVLGGSSGGSSQAVNLTINTKINLTGSLVSSGGLEDMKLVMPGQANSTTADGNTPYYNDVMGIFNLTAMPQVTISEQSWSNTVESPFDGSMQTDYGVTATCFIDPTTLPIIWNPAIINSTNTGATIQNMNVDLIEFLPDNDFGDERAGNLNLNSYRNTSASAPTVLTYYTEIESVPGAQVWTPVLGVRISFDVVPNNGGQRCKIVKTFTSNQL